ncbi:Putative zinc-or iron-chelating domain-containing protein [Maridesulfovibrio ferrireducens]|uniref:Putative zinc-or iron-chelating domain-containing protein n=1 Tax=Maridesulfovibrio ferrireducens TaxID=246191 RepID=A0A1G9KA31_9BACT|nr:YkgJ family cysteine cluster protein [Maridesulfovibrio ferrireducens]SDL46489.1 Putative zinc-or iron-chelating domain-containing protein [Maridesulfovibrio ferrireducens]
MNSSPENVINNELAHVYAMFEAHIELQKWFKDMALAVCADLKGLTPDNELFARMIADKGMRCFEANFNAVVGQISNLDPTFQVACREGCSYCCFSHITLVPQEAFNIALYLAEKLDASDFEKIVEVCVEGAEGFDSAGLHEFTMKYFRPCPFLKDNKCSIYEVRPIACRNWISHDLGPCIKSHESKDCIAVPQNAVIMIQKDLIFAGQQAFLDELGINGHIASFLPLMEQVLTDYEGTYASWLSGESLRGQMERK